jgi:hypothetical protein
MELVRSGTGPLPFEGIPEPVRRELIEPQRFPQSAFVLIFMLPMEFFFVFLAARLAVASGDLSRTRGIQAPVPV